MLILQTSNLYCTISGVSLSSIDANHGGTIPKDVALQRLLGLYSHIAVIKEVFNELYKQMNNMPLQEIDKIICPVCKLCRDHERAGFVEGIKIGVCLLSELTK